MKTNAFKVGDSVRIVRGPFGEYLYLAGSIGEVVKVGRELVHVQTTERHANGRLFRPRAFQPRFLTAATAPDIA